jgi:5,10-methylenetetrahydromethanopterin reductase
MHSEVEIYMNGVKPSSMSHGLLLSEVNGKSRTTLAVHAEELGYESVWLGELWGASSSVQLAEIAGQTETITLGTAILNVFSRTPATLAMTANGLDRVSDGRFVLGVGTSTQKAIEDLHGMTFDRPVRRAHETIELTKRFLGHGEGTEDTTSGDGRVAYDGEMFHAADFPPLDADVPVYHAALGRANRRVVARLCDGWIPHNVPFPNLDEAFAYVAEHAEKAGRDPDDITVAPYVPAAVAEDPDVARDAIRGHVAYYAGSGEGYRQTVASQFPDTADRIAEAWQSGERQQAADHVSDEMVTALGVAGTPDEARTQLRDLTENSVIDHPIVTLPQQTADKLAEPTIEALAPEKL